MLTHNVSQRPATFTGGLTPSASHGPAIGSLSRPTPPDLKADVAYLYDSCHQAVFNAGLSRYPRFAALRHAATVGQRLASHSATDASLRTAASGVKAGFQSLQNATSDDD